jgi:hypothetical protein
MRSTILKASGSTLREFGILSYHFEGRLKCKITELYYDLPAGGDQRERPASILDDGIAIYANRCCELCTSSYFYTGSTSGMHKLHVDNEFECMLHILEKNCRRFSICLPAA